MSLARKLGEKAARLSASRALVKNLTGAFDKFPAGSKVTNARTPWEYGRRLSKRKSLSGGHLRSMDDSEDKRDETEESGAST